MSLFPKWLVIVSLLHIWGFCSCCWQITLVSWSLFLAAQEKTHPGIIRGNIELLFFPNCVSSFHLARLWPVHNQSHCHIIIFSLWFKTESNYIRHQSFSSQGNLLWITYIAPNHILTCDESLSIFHFRTHYLWLNTSTMLGLDLCILQWAKPWQTTLRCLFCQFAWQLTNDCVTQMVGPSVDERQNWLAPHLTCIPTSGRLSPKLVWYWSSTSLHWYW